MTFEEYLTSFEGKRVAVIGIGISNQPLIELLLQRGIAVTARDKKDRTALGTLAGDLESRGAVLRLGEDYLEDLTEDVIFRTPGMRPDLPQLRQAVAAESARVKQTAQAIAQRTSVMRKTVSDNELFTFRVWLVRMGLNGDEFKNTRDHLLANLEGNRAWRYDKDCYASSHKNRTSQQEQER